ncbi:hypothetical protein [Streptomyces sp. NPDC059881]
MRSQRSRDTHMCQRVADYVCGVLGQVLVAERRQQEEQARIRRGLPER